MSEIKCPKCGTTFKVDDASYADILSQVRGAEFENELHARLKESEKQAAADKELALAKSETEIEQLKAKLKAAETEKELAVAKALAPVEKERDQLASDLKAKANEAQLRETSIVAQYKGALKLKDDEIQQLKDMKAKLSTKMIGETLEQHCQNSFNQIRMAAFPNAYFEKDNDARTGSKGDYIFRECDEQGNEIISIMFEMKNENETTATKHKNEDFFKELDKDRQEKKCEYAVLVSLLEADSELYNTGIVDVSYKYEKMYVIRPQFFIPIITLLRNAALNSMKYKKELVEVKNQDIDISNFERDMNEWKAGWANTMKNAGKKHLEAIEQINKAIKDLEKTRDALMMSDKHLAIAEGKLDDLSIKRLTRGNPTMRAKFEELEKDKS
ncbi:DUF2130 domain-containing protein [Candidatus Saccharibacteria bacterium]|nr:DUF2130 domain-containing protein [Candidatus Saccharibacteria bacterium]